MSRESIGKPLQLASVVAVILAPLPSLYILAKIWRPMGMEQDVLNNYKVMLTYCLGVMAFIFVLGAVMFAIGRKLKRKA